MTKNLLSISDLSKKEILDLIEFARNFKNEDGSFRKQLLIFSANQAPGQNHPLK